MNKSQDRTQARQRVRTRVRHRVKGSGDRPRLAVFKSGRHIYAQVNDDADGKTLAAASSLRAGFLAVVPLLLALLALEPRLRSRSRAAR